MDWMKKDLVKESAKSGDLERIPTDKFIIGYTGTLGLANALEYFVEAAGMQRDDPRFFFVLVGERYLKKTIRRRK
jgi:hypothetical protein